MFLMDTLLVSAEEVLVKAKSGYHSFGDVICKTCKYFQRLNPYYFFIFIFLSENWFHYG